MQELDDSLHDLNFLNMHDHSLQTKFAIYNVCLPPW